MIIIKKLLLLIILLIPFKVSASIVVGDTDTGRVFYNSRGNEVKLIASTTKILTALVVINNANLDDIVTIDQSVLKSFGSGIYVSIGEEISVRDLLYGLLLRSGNDAAIALANYVGGSEEAFALMMNEFAKSINMNNSHFINASGLENELGNGNTSTALDMFKLMSYAVKNKEFIEISGEYHHQVKTNLKSYDWYNKNKLLSMYKYTTAGKTGYTKKAHRTLVTSASKNGKNLAVVTLDEDNDFNVHKNMYETYFNKYKLINIIDSNTFLRDEKHYVDDDFNMMLLDSEIDKVKVNVNYTNDALDRVGFVTVSLDDQEYFKEDIYEYKEIENKSIFDKIKKFFYNIFH